jgi:N-acetylglucosaminyldiphosphoundecaprenol N-acetyl-beta-D-mannosaminyltransferase
MRAQKKLLPEIPRVNVLGVGVSAIDMESALSVVKEALEHGQRGYVCVTGVHGVMEAQADPDFRRIQNLSMLTTPDGMPLVWAGRLGAFRIGRVYGPDLMQNICGISPGLGYRHFFFGGKPGVAQKLKHTMEAKFPGLAVVGTYTPPFRRLTAAEEADLYRMVEAGKPDLFWVGLSTPKQERFMSEYINRLPVKIMVGVGAAFDIHTGAIKDSPGWVKNAGLQWLHRLLQEPKRLWRRYLFNNPRFLYQAMLQLLRLKQFPMIGLAESRSRLATDMYLPEMAKGDD